MTSFGEYSLLRSSESEGDEGGKESYSRRHLHFRRLTFVSGCLVLIACISLLVAGFAGGLFISRNLLTSSQTTLKSSNPACTSPAIRKEWRSLNATEKHAYTDAVQCLHELPSIFGPNQTHYDDFPYVHMHFGNITHDTAGFLPWHRYFIHTYERTLKEKCGFTGQMPYWDWTLDWADFRNSPVFDPDTGFGGDGSPDAPKSVGQGRCVVDGPFAGLKLQFSNMRRHPHCLSRGLPGDTELQRWTSGFRPEAIRQVMDLKEYHEFFLALEDGPHLSIPYSIRGDFYRFTAPNGRRCKDPGTVV